MRNESEMFDLILSTAQNDSRIRAVILNGSRANPNAPKDIYQDYDIIYLVTETQSFLENPTWIDCFGERLIMQLPDKLDAAAGFKMNFDQSFTYLMQFKDGNRIDLRIQTQQAVAESLEGESETIILLDKDNRFPNFPSPSDSAYWIKQPTSDTFFHCCNEFWWVVLYVGKGLCRNEIPYAMDCLNVHVRPELVKMLSWYAGISIGFSFSAGKSGKYLPRYLSKDLWERFLQTYPCGSVDAIWESVFIVCQLFHETAQAVCKEFHLPYCSDTAENCIEYLRQLKASPSTDH